jgi:hypothetical protein
LLDDEIRYALKIAEILRQHRHVVSTRCRRNQEVVCSDLLPGRKQLRLDMSGYSRRLQVEGQDWNKSEYRLKRPGAAADKLECRPVPLPKSIHWQ